MKIDKAIEILELYMKPSDDIEPVDFDNAIKLGTKALKRIIDQRRQYPEISSKPLPGETLEGR